MVVHEAVWKAAEVSQTSLHQCLPSRYGGAWWVFEVDDGCLRWLMGHMRWWSLGF